MSPGAWPWPHCPSASRRWAGCGDDSGSDGGAAAKKGADGPAALTVSAQSTGAKTAKYEMPASLEAGLTKITFTNNAKGPREADLVRVEGDHSAKEVLEVVNSQGGEKIPPWIHAEGGVATVTPGRSSTSTQVLAPGRYYMTDSSDPDSGVKPAVPFGFEVTGAASDATLPKAPGRITASEYRFQISGLQTGRNEVRFENTGSELHHAIVIPELPGATKAQVLKFLQSQGKGGGKPPIDFQHATGTTVLDGGTEQNTALTLRKGKYAVVCFLTDRAGGPPHVTKGMFGEFDVK